MTAHARRARSQIGPIRIGTSLALSGGQAQPGAYTLIGARIAIQQLNENGGIDGRQVELVVRDNRFSPTDMIGQLRELAGGGINLFMGDTSSTMNLAAVPIIPSLDAVYVVSSTILIEITHDLFNRNCFRAGASSCSQFFGQAKVLADIAPSAKRWGCLLGDAAGFHFAQQYLYYGMKKYYGAKGAQIELLDPVLAKIGAPDFRDQISKLTSQDLDGILVCHAGAEAISFLKQGVPFGLYKNLKAFADLTFVPDIGSALRKDMPHNYISFCPWYYPAYRQFPMVDDFYKRAVQETKTEIISSYLATGHLVVTTLIEGVRNAKSGKTEDVIGAIETMKYPTLFGPMQFRKEDHQLEFNSGYVRLNPDDSNAGWKISEYITVPWQDIMEAASPGKKYELPKT